MTNEELLADLKQFVTATVSQATAGLSTKEDLASLATKDDVANLIVRVDSLEAIMNERFNEVMNAVGEDIVKHEKLIENHHLRITRLEQEFAQEARDAIADEDGTISIFANF